MEVLEKSVLSKRQMLERIQFSKNLQMAIRANELLTGKLSENDAKGMFLDAILRDDYKDALMRADDHNLCALKAKDFTIQKFRYIRPDNNNYVSGEVVYLKIKTVNGIVEVTPPVAHEGDELKYPNMKSFLYEWSIAI